MGQVGHQASHLVRIAASSPHILNLARKTAQSCEDVGMSTAFCTLDELAHQTGLPRAWLRRESDAGRIPCVKVGRRRMFDAVQVRMELTRRAEVTGGTHAK